MSETIQTKYCSKCKKTLPLSEFGKNRSKKDGLQSYCKSCQKAYEQSENGRAAHYKATAKYRKTSEGKAKIKRFNARNPNYVKATNAVNNAIHDGRLPRPDCFPCYYCPAQAQEYHHWHGYEPECWLDVIPVCRECHLKEHRKTA